MRLTTCVILLGLVAKLYAARIVKKNLEIEKNGVQHVIEKLQKDENKKHFNEAEKLEEKKTEKEDEIAASKKLSKLKKSIGELFSLAKSMNARLNNKKRLKERVSGKKVVGKQASSERIFTLSTDVHLGNYTLTWNKLLCYIFPQNCEDVDLSPQCPAGNFACFDGSCITSYWECDDYDDCGDLSDESHCSIECPEGKVKCQKQPRCVPDNWICDGYNDCDDGSDEVYCENGGQSSFSFSSSESEPHSSTSESQTSISYGSSERSDDETSCAWSDWGSWSLCNAGCGSGISNRTRICECSHDNCIGNAHEYFICLEPDGCRPEAATGCGARNPTESRARIVGGEYAAEGAWPWQALLFHNGFFTCGGSLYENQFIITAAHCVYNSLNPAGWRVYLGKQELSTSVEDNAQFSSTISHIVLHEDYNPTTLDNDIAILKLTEPVSPPPNADSLINNICIARPDMIFSPGSMCFITGWGATSESGLPASSLLEAEVPYIGEGSACYEFDGYTADDFTPNMICAGYEDGGVDACQGDSGGPLVCKYPDSDGNVDRWYLVGITSWGYGCARAETPGVYTKVQNYNNWIIQEVVEL
ncbi:transmembrane protease serine 3-like [Anneissia japonica]|uniref:transmembrane protease serine 3-like n=1 Tax=Anneissia japonica TaxID=1529436 RepID=UPI001425ACE9|nr:transmembrane protease serine 3-like [Anneissia japonica]